MAIVACRKLPEAEFERRKLIDEMNEALQAHVELQHRLFGLLQRAYKDPFHHRIPRDHATAIRKWLDRNDPAVGLFRRVRRDFMKKFVCDADSLLINGCFADGTVPKIAKLKRKRGRNT